MSDKFPPYWLDPIKNAEIAYGFRMTQAIPLKEDAIKLMGLKDYVSKLGFRVKVNELDNMIEIIRREDNVQIAICASI